jgi:ribosomal protein L29
MNKAIKDIRGNDIGDLKAQLADLRKEQWQLRFKGPEQGARPSRQREIRRTIARILTVLGERERAGSSN